MSKLPEHLYLDRLATPIGDALIVADEDGYLRALDWADHEDDMLRTLRRQYGEEVVPEAGVIPCAIKTRLRDYFDGNIGSLRAIDDRLWAAAPAPSSTR